MRIDDFFDDRGLDLRDLWEALKADPPGRIIDPPSDGKDEAAASASPASHGSAA